MNASARSEMSVAVTCSAWCRRWKVWMPQPVPRSRALATWRRTVVCTSVVEACPIPRTWSWRSTPALLVRGEVAGHPELGAAAAVLIGVPAVRPQVRFRLQQVLCRDQRRLFTPIGRARLQQPELHQAVGPDSRQGGVERLRASAVRPGARDARRRRAPPSLTVRCVTLRRSLEGAPVTISAGMSWSRSSARYADSPSSSATPSSV